MQIKVRNVKSLKYKNLLQALGMLFWHKHNIERALSDLPNFTPFPDEWSVEDKVLFEQAFGFHGKSFHRIKQMVSSSVLIGFIDTCLCNFCPWLYLSSLVPLLKLVMNSLLNGV